jgi:hypothetical protein
MMNWSYLDCYIFHCDLMHGNLDLFFTSNNSWMGVKHSLWNQICDFEYLSSLITWLGLFFALDPPSGCRDEMIGDRNNEELDQTIDINRTIREGTVLSLDVLRVRSSVNESLSTCFIEQLSSEWLNLSLIVCCNSLISSVSPIQTLPYKNHITLLVRIVL